jgi:hypothetical protein
MQCQFIASRNSKGRSLKLFRIGEYQYEICELVQGEFQRVRLLINHDVDQAIAALEGIQ